MIGLLLALQIVTADPCLQGAGGDPTTADVVTGDLTLNFCWTGPPQAVFTILLDGQPIWTGPIQPLLKSPSGPNYYEWHAAPPTIPDGPHTIAVLTAGNTIPSPARPILKRPAVVPPPFNVHATSTP